MNDEVGTGRQRGTTAEERALPLPSQPDSWALYALGEEAVCVGAGVREGSKGTFKLPVIAQNRPRERFCSLAECVCICCSVVSDSLRPLDCSPPAPLSVGTLQARIPEWGAISISGRASLLAQMIKIPPAMQTQVRSLGREDPLEKTMATHARIVAWKIPWTEEPGGLRSIMGSQRVGQVRETNTSTPGRGTQKTLLRKNKVKLLTQVNLEQFE